MDRTNCSEECKARSPLGSEGHISTCPEFDSVLLPFMPRDRQSTDVTVVRGPDDRPVHVPDEVISEHERDYRSYKKWRAGKTWEDIAHEEQYDSPDAAHYAVKRYLDEGKAVMRDMTRAEIVADHVSRLQWLRSNLQAGIEAGKPNAIMAALALEDRWVKAFGLDIEQVDDQRVPTVVVPSESYLEALRAASSETGEASAG